MGEGVPKKRGPAELYLSQSKGVTQARIFGKKEAKGRKTTALCPWKKKDRR